MGKKKNPVKPKPLKAKDRKPVVKTDGERWTALMEAFCQEYVIDLNGTQAAIRAGYSAETATSAASRLLTYVKVKKRIQQFQDSIAAARSVTKERILDELQRIAFGDTRAVVRFENGKLVVTDSNKLSDAEASMISEISQKTGNTNEKKVKFHDKQKALELLMRHMGMLKADDGGKFSGVVILTQGEDKL